MNNVVSVNVLSNVGECHNWDMYSQLTIYLHMAKDKRYTTVKNLITGGYIKSFSEIWDTLPKTIVARDLKKHHQTFSKLISNPERLRFEEAMEIASLIDIEGIKIISLIYSEIDPNKKNK